MSEKCVRCNEKIDRSDATKEFSILTVKGQTTKRYYLCETCTAKAVYG